MKWEYKKETLYNIEYSKLIKHLNIFGDEGWELVHLVYTVVDEDSTYYVCIFKRPIK